ncbi:ABC transporter permease subunit [Pelagicoccus sp. NFK12]|uniref:ABC transporter permease subunit n=1 Tax=Pelagicoccus enzymogenes TaxID=2773457 RepID=A0A927F6X4_9BACT|nr:ABC transporter permease subunit [Pelagicoccus enzymogenes]MBD5779347.1 ABC transporter permease subunit [Pelagicoccus enzymogenes]
MKGIIDRIAAIAGNTFREAIRMRLILLLVVSGVVSLAGGLYFQEFNLGSSELRFIADFGFGAMTLLGSIVAVVATVQLCYGEIEQRTILPILSKPVSRGEFLIGKLLGAWLTICSFIGILTLALILALWIRELQMPDWGVEDTLSRQSVSYSGVLLFAAMQCLRLMVLASITAFFSSYASSSMFAVFMGFFVWVIAQLRGSLVAEWGDGIGQSALKVVTLLIPDLRVFDLGYQALDRSEPLGASVLSLVVYAFVYSVLYGCLAALVLKHREL